jgi:hypothetical protein
LATASLVMLRWPDFTSFLSMLSKSLICNRCVDNVFVEHRVYAAGYVYTRISKQCTTNGGVHFADVGQEFIAPVPVLTGTFHEAAMSTNSMAARVSSREGRIWSRLLASVVITPTAKLMVQNWIIQSDLGLGV